jgi:hypothetical protein
MGVIIPLGHALFSWHFRMAGDSGDVVFTMGADMQAVAANTTTANDAYDAFVGSGAMATMSTDTVLYLCAIEAPSGNVANYFEDNAGGEAGASMPPNCAQLVQKRTALAGRKQRGRLYLPPMRATYYNSSGILGATQAADLQDAMDDFLTAFNAIGTGLEADILHSDIGDSPTEITSLVVEAQLSTQRRRLRD